MTSPLAARTLRFPDEACGLLTVYLPEGPVERQAEGLIEVPEGVAAKLQLNNTHREVLASLQPGDLQSLLLLARGVTVADLQQVARLEGLRELGLSGQGRYGNASVAAISGLTSLRRVFVPLKNTVGDKGFALLTQLPELVSLNVQSSQITDAALASLTGLTELAHLSLSGNPQLSPGAVIAAVAGLPGMRSLWLGEIALTDDDLAPLAALTKLSDVTFRGSSVTVAGLRHLPKTEEPLTVIGLGAWPTLEEWREVEADYPHIQLIGYESLSPQRADPSLRDRLIGAGKPFGAAGAEDAPLLVMFTTSSCHPCELLKPELEKVTHSLQPRMRTVIVNAEHSWELARELNVQGAPTLVLLPDPTTTQRVVGRTAADLLSELEPLVG